MSDLVNRLRDGGKEASPRGELMWKASKRIEQLERELARARVSREDDGMQIIGLQSQLTAEKALADRLALLLDVPFQSRMNMYHYKHCHVDEALDAHRKTRGL